MQRYFLFILFLSFFTLANASSFAKQMQYHTDFNSAKLESMQNGKAVMILFVTKMCPWCKKLEKQTLQKSNVDMMVKENFVPVILDKDEASYPKIFETKLVPTIHFYDPIKKQIIDSIYGYKQSEKFKELLNQIKVKYRSKP